MTTAADLARFRTILTGWLGLSLAGTPEADLAALLAERAGRSEGAGPTGADPAAYLDRLETRPSAERAVLAGKLTVPETHLFRHVEQFRAVAEVAVPERTREKAAGTLNVLSAACATGARSRPSARSSTRCGSTRPATTSAGCTGRPPPASAAR